MRVVLAAALLLASVSGADGARPRPQLFEPTWSPSGTRIAYIRNAFPGTRIVVADMRGRGARTLPGPEPSLRGLAWAPDESALAYINAGHLWRVDVETGETTQLTAVPGEDALQPAWSPDGTTIAYAAFDCCSRGSAIHAVPATGGADRVLAPTGRRPEWDRTGAQLLTSYPVQLVDVATGAATLVAASGFSAAWSGDHSWFVFTDGGVRLGQPGRTVPPALIWKGSGISLPALNPFATRVAVVSGRRVYVRFVHRGPVVRLPGSDSPGESPAWSFRRALAYVADGPCGPQSQISVARPDGTHAHALVRACRPTR